MAPDFVKQILMTGTTVEIGSSYAPTFVAEFVGLAVRYGGHLIIRADGYAPQFVIGWAQSAPKNVTIKL